MAIEAQRIFVVCTDLMFSARIREAGAMPGAVFEFIGSKENSQKPWKFSRPRFS